MDSKGTIHGGRQVVYTDSPRLLIRMAREYGGKAWFSKGNAQTRWLRFEIAGTTYYPGAENVTLESVKQLEEFAARRNVKLGALPSVAFNLFRTTLPRTIEVAGRGETIPQKYPRGARLHAAPGLYRDCVSFDIRAAYLWSIGTLRFPVAYCTPSRVKLSELALLPGSFARARVSFKRRDVPFGILPALRKDGSTAWVNKGGHTLILTGEDLTIAHLCGAHIRIDRAWVGVSFVSPFERFYELGKEMRQSCGTLGKQVANMLWGVFWAGGADVWEAKFEPGARRFTTRQLNSREPLSFPIGASVLSRIRSKVFMEGVSRSTVHVHTDGVISTAPPLVSYGDEPGDWRLVGTLDECEVLAPGWYRYRVGATEKFKLAGRVATEEKARRIFHHRRGEYERQEKTYGSAEAWADFHKLRTGHSRPNSSLSGGDGS
jgi:hypothetical protein